MGDGRRNGNDDLMTVTFRHDTVSGTPREAGLRAGEVLRSRGVMPQEIERGTDGTDTAAPDVPRDAAGAGDPAGASGAARGTAESDEQAGLLGKHAPWLLEEVSGLAEGLGVLPEQVLDAVVPRPIQVRCGHFALLPPRTADGRAYHGRSYEYWLGRSDLRLCSTTLSGCAGHIGFSELLFGRNDGINEHGLCVSISVSGGVPGTQEGNGLHYAVVTRILLDSCGSVDEALERLETLPVGSCVNFVLSDAAGNAALFEAAGPMHAVKRAVPGSAAGGSGDSESFIVSTNHYTMLRPSYAYTNSIVRYNKTKDWIVSCSGRLDARRIMTFLELPYPEGLASWVRLRRRGTLWAMVFDPAGRGVEIRFGPPLHNPWHRFEPPRSAGAGTGHAPAGPPAPAPGSAPETVTERSAPPDEADLYEAVFPADPPD